MDGDPVTALLVVGAILLGLSLLGLVIGVLVLGVRAFPHMVGTAFHLFAWAAEQGFIGVALYVILWIVATPLMFVVCIVGGIIGLLNADIEPERQVGKRDEPVKITKSPSIETTEYMDLANRRGRWANGPGEGPA